MIRYLGARYVIADRVKGCFYGVQLNSDEWAYTESCFDAPSDFSWRMYVARGGYLSVEGATENHQHFLAALKGIIQEYPNLPAQIDFGSGVQNVSELLQQPTQRLEDIVFLHGTTDAFLEDILKNGLHPRSETGVAPSYGTQNNAPEGKRDLIYLTTQHSTAAMAAHDARRAHGGNSIILAVGPGLRSLYAEVDEDYAVRTPMESLAVSGNIAYRRNIPPSMIHVHERSTSSGWERVSSVCRTAKWEEHDLVREATKLNQQYFGGELNLDFPMVYRSTLRQYGAVGATYNKYTKVVTTKQLSISNRYKMDPEQFRGILAHELIHVALFQRGILYDIGARHHGIHFKREVERLRGMGLDVPLSEDVPRMEADYGREFAKPIHAIVYDRKSIRVFRSMDQASLTRETDNNSWRAWRAKQPILVEHVTSTNPMLRKFKVSQSLKTSKGTYRLSPEQYDALAPDITSSTTFTPDMY